MMGDINLWNSLLLELGAYAFCETNLIRRRHLLNFGPSFVTLRYFTRKEEDGEKRIPRGKLKVMQLQFHDCFSMAHLSIHLRSKAYSKRMTITLRLSALQNWFLLSTPPPLPLFELPPPHFSV